MIGEKIKQLRKSRGLTQSELARLCNLSKNAIYNYENNKRDIPINTLKIIAEELFVSIIELLESEITTVEILQELERRNKDE